MAFYFVYNNKHSFKDLGLFIEEIPVLPSFTEEDSFITINFAYKVEQECNYKYDMLRSLFRSGIGELTLSNSFDKFLNVTNIEFREIERNKTFVKNEVIFTLEPYFYFREGKNVLEIANGLSLINELICDSNPIIKIYGNGQVTLSINNKSLDFYIRYDHIIIDSVLKECYWTNGLLNNDAEISFFPVLLPGENTISWYGDITKVEIIPNWRC